MPEFLKAWGIVSTHGRGASRLLKALRSEISEPTDLEQEAWPIPANGRSLAFYSPGPREGSVRAQLGSRLRTAWEEAAGMLSQGELSNLRENGGLIFASTKGCVEDFIWTGVEGDPYSPIVEDFLATSGLRPKRWLTVSNACASSHSAVTLAREWLARGELAYVVVVAADFVGPFVLQGFHALHALSPTTIRPFDRNRDGLLLGEAAAVAIFSVEEGPLRLSGTAINCEGHAVTRPEGTAASLQRAIFEALGADSVGAVISHGTATLANDRAEDRAFAAQLPHSPWITGTKWSIGHTLGASGLADLIAAAEWLSANAPFAIATCLDPDPEFSSRILTPTVLKDLALQNWDSLLITSLGFGGVHAALRLERQ